MSPTCRDMSAKTRRVTPILARWVRVADTIFSMSFGVDYMPYEWNRIIRFFGWWLELFGTKLCMLAISYCRFWDCISIFFVHLSTDSVIPGAKGGTSIFSDGFFAVQSNAFIRIHISRWFCWMGHYRSYSFCHRHSMSLLRLIVTEFFGQTS